MPPYRRAAAVEGPRPQLHHIEKKRSPQMPSGRRAVESQRQPGHKTGSSWQRLCWPPARRAGNSITPGTDAKSELISRLAGRGPSLRSSGEAGESRHSWDQQSLWQSWALRRPLDSCRCSPAPTCLIMQWSSPRISFTTLCRNKENSLVNPHAARRSPDSGSAGH